MSEEPLNASAICVTSFEVLNRFSRHSNSQLSDTSHYQAPSFLSSQLGLEKLGYCSLLLCLGSTNVNHAQTIAFAANRSESGGLAGTGRGLTSTPALRSEDGCLPSGVPTTWSDETGNVTNIMPSPLHSTTLREPCGEMLLLVRQA